MKAIKFYNTYHHYPYTLLKIVAVFFPFWSSYVILSGIIINPVYAQQSSSKQENVVDIKSRRELFVDNTIVETLSGSAEMRMHHPVPREIAIAHDAPWEGNSCVYHSIFKDGDIYRMYYRGSHISVNSEGTKINEVTHPWHFCYAESKDGITWTKPNLKLFEFAGSKENNIVFSNKDFGNFKFKSGDNASFFKDENPDADKDALYKAIITSRYRVQTNPEKWRSALFAFKSPDGIHWSPISETPIITDGAFDSQNLAFWDSTTGKYRSYWRYFDRGTPDNPYQGVRAIRTATSADFINWEDQTDLTYVDSPAEHLYTNQILPYYRAPHILMGFPTRYVERGWSPSMHALPDTGNRKLRSSFHLRYGTALDDCLFMTSRDGKLFNRKNEAFVRPGPERPGVWNYGHHYFGWGIVETNSALEGASKELSFYSTESYWTDKPNDLLRRYTLRIDGFVSLYAPSGGGTLVTKPILFEGDQLYLNFSTSAAGSVRVEIQDLNGKPLAGYSLKDCHPVFGDSIDRSVVWENKGDLASIHGKKVRLVFELKDADLFSFQFR